MKTFFNLVQDVQKKGRCHRCGGCVAFCIAAKYDALELDDTGRPCYKEIGNCIECGICYSICPEIDELKQETKENAGWCAPMGRIIETSVARSKDDRILKKATDGGVVTALLAHLFHTGRIDGAIVTRPSQTFTREPWLAVSMEEMLDSAGFYYDTSHGMVNFSDEYSSESSIETFTPMINKGLKRVALVATPCQINAFRRMAVLGIVPSDAIRYSLGLFCSGNFTFGESQQAHLAKENGFSWDDVEKMNIKNEFRIHMKDSTIIKIDVKDLDFMKQPACDFCLDYASEFADISFGGIGAEQGWTTVITRTEKGQAVFNALRENHLEELTYKKSGNVASRALAAVRKASSAKKKQARQRLREMDKNGVNVIG